MAEMTEAEVIRDLAFTANAPHVVEQGRRYAWHQPDGTFNELDLTKEMPSRKCGTVTVRNVDSFKAYWDKHHDAGSEVFADLDEGTVTAVLDAHENNGPRWQGHRLVLRLELTEAWQTWAGDAGFDRRMIPQETFANFLEDNYRDLAPAGEQVLVHPGLTVRNVSAADFLEIAQKLQGTTTVTFGHGVRLDNGDVQFGYTEATTTTAGRKGDLTVPQVFSLAIAPYEDCAERRITARLRTQRGAEGGMKLGYFLMQPERVRQEAVEQIAAEIAAELGVTVMRGQPS